MARWFHSVLHSVLLGIFTLVMVGKSQALDINLLNIDVNGPEGQRASEFYGNAYGFSPQQVMPALLGPAEEVPAILRIAQAAGTVPMSVWMMRKMGMSYNRILQNFALAPATLLGASSVSLAPIGYSAPAWSQVLNPFYVQSSRVSFLRDILKVDPLKIALIPSHGWEFTRAVLQPYPSQPYWLPPGQAKKQGLWLPPGQAKKRWVREVSWRDDDDGFVKTWRVQGKKGKRHEQGGGGWKKHGKGHGKGGHD